MKNTNQKANIQSSKTPTSAGQKPNRQQAGRKKPNAIWSHTIDGTTISIVPRHAGRVAVRIGHQEGQYYRSLCCSFISSRLQEIEMDGPLGTIVLDGVDVMTPELCKEKEYRDDGYGYTKHLAVMRVSTEMTVWSVTCTLCARDGDGHIRSTGDYHHVISVQIDNTAVQAMLRQVGQWKAEPGRKTATSPSPDAREKTLNIYVDD